MSDSARSSSKSKPSKKKKQKSGQSAPRDKANHRPSLEKRSSGRRAVKTEGKVASSPPITPSGDDGRVLSIAKTLAQLRSVPSNRSCADCRSPLVDSSQTFASISPAPEIAMDSGATEVPSVGSFQFNHETFAPEGAVHRVRRKTTIDPAILVTKQLGGHGVFLCTACARAHKSMGLKVTKVYSVKDTSLWTTSDVKFLLEAGGNAKSWAVFEGFMPESWKKRRPTDASTLEERQVFCRAKYDALAFVTPSGGPLSSRAWRNIVDGRTELGRWRTEDLLSFQRITVSERRSKSMRRVTSSMNDPLPSRLVDFFCVIGFAGRLERKEVERDLSTVSSPEEFRLEPTVLDCWPDPEAHNDMDFPEHVSTFVFPEGYRACEHQKTPVLFNFVLTSASGQRLYGAALHVYDETIDTDQFRQILPESGYTVPLPWWLQDDLDALPNTRLASSSRKRPSEVTFLPKCLVVVSHYPFLDLWRRFLKQLYRITMVEAPLPVERYVVNFVSEIPLPPQGRVEVKFGFTEDELWSVCRPPENELPLVAFSYRPLFASLSVSNVLVVMGLLMQETRVVLLSRYYSLLTPTAEALVSLLFPFEWQGMYIPVMPYSMSMDILDAPVPFLIGLHSRYLAEVKPERRPKGLVFVDLDRDTIHLGINEEEFTDDQGNLLPRMAPDLPERDAVKLKSKLDEFAGMAYLAPDSGIKGRILTGDGVLLVNARRPPYAQMTNVEGDKTASLRAQVFAKTDRAFLNNRAISGFLSEQGQLTGRDSPQKEKVKDKNRMKQLFQRSKKSSDVLNGDPKQVPATAETSLLDMNETYDGFSPSEIRSAFLRFFVTVFNQYERFLNGGSERDLFRSTDFLSSLSLSSSSRTFVSKMLETQMFQAFLEERKKNPDDHEILLFDESIVAKNNRSKKTTLAKGGKRETPFLDDTSAKITDIFIPPTPSNSGLPDDGRKYQYGSFPKLDSSLIGHIRPAKVWPQEKKTYQRRRATKPSALAKQQELLNRALQPSSSSVPTIITKRQEPSVKDMEWAVSVVSAVEGSLNKPDINNSDFGKTPSALKGGVQAAAEQFPARQRILSARRKQSIMIQIVTRLQACYRMYAAKKLRHRLREDKLHAVRISRQKLQSDEIYLLDACAVAIQRKSRGYLARKAFARYCDAILMLQRVVRGQQARAKALRLRSVIRIQRWVRMTSARCYFVALRQSAAVIQSVSRGRRARFAFSLLRDDVCKLQALVRGYFTRKVVAGIIKKRSLRYRHQAFVLWNCTHTPLSYRSKLWPLIDGSGFLRLRLAETELKRLWRQLEVPFPAGMQSSLPLSNDENFRQATSMGLSNKCYVRSVLVNHMIDDAMKRDSKRIFPSESSSVVKKAAERENAERLQIYERLGALTDLKFLNDMYLVFGIDPNEKLKKSKLSNLLWLNLRDAGNSSSLILKLFPELRTSTSIAYKAPSRKGLKKFRVKDSVVAPLDSSMQVDAMLDQIVRTNVTDFAAMCIRHVPSLTIQLSKNDHERSEKFRRRCRAAMYARKTSSWSLCRYEIITSFLYVADCRKLSSRDYTSKRHRRKTNDAKNDRIHASARKLPRP